MVIKTNFYYQYVHLLHTYNYSTYTNARRLYLDSVIDRSNHISPNITRISTSRLTFQNEMGFTFGKIRYILRVFYSRTFLNVTHISVQLYKLFTELIILYWYSYNEVQRAWYTWEWDIVNLATVLSKYNLEIGWLWKKTWFRCWGFVTEELIPSQIN